ncbi:MAG: EAL domain-containing protein [Pseudomonadota bacterium]
MPFWGATSKMPAPQGARCSKNPPEKAEAPFAGPQRSLSAVMLRRTLTITILLGMIVAGFTMWSDLQREKEAVERLADDFMSSVTPSAAAAVYNYDDEAAHQIAEGLFLSRSITAVRIFNEGDLIVDMNRRVTPTLPQFGAIGSSDEIVLNRMLYEPEGDQDTAPIGELSITLDRSLVAPEFVDRLLSFFVVTTAKNILFGLLLYVLVFNVLAMHISILAQAAQAWQPNRNAMMALGLPKFLRGTEVDGLGNSIQRLSSSATDALDTIQQSHDAVVDTNTALSDAVEDRTLKLEKANARLQNMADHDALTGLYNRAFFDRHIATAFGRKETARLSILLIDVDHFKAFNDFYGHQAGDDALAEVGRALRTIQDQTGSIMARYGGEEFVCLVNASNATPKQVAEQIHKMLNAIAIEHQHSAVARHLTVSIGAATTAEQGNFVSTDALVSAADDALYEAKSQGRNQTVISTPEIRARAHAQRSSLQALLHAIDEREFEPFLQPQVDARTGEIVGAEALVRWVRASGEVTPPVDFMQTAEATGLINKIDAIMLDKIGEFLGEFPNILPNLSLNVTGDSVRKHDYVKKIIELSHLSDTGITAELLETAFIDRPDQDFLWQLDSLRDVGVEVELDDFGTGRTSILGLMTINPSRLKIARELITPLGTRDEQANLVNSVIEIARSLNANVLAEGVETKETADLLINLGCPIQQGFFHGKPMPLSQFVETMKCRRTG